MLSIDLIISYVDMKSYDVSNSYTIDQQTNEAGRDSPASYYAFYVS